MQTIFMINLMNNPLTQLSPDLFQNLINLRTIFLSLALVSSAAVSIASAQNTPAKSPDFFEEKIRPVLIKNCYSCHTTSAMGGLRLDSEDAMKTGGKRGAAVVPGR